jgi:hypothetical protein
MSVTTIALLTTAVVAAAGAGEIPSLQGRYAMAAMGACLTSPNGFHPNNVAIEPSSTTSVVNQGTLTFHRDGTGLADVVQTQLNLPPAAAAFSGSARITFQFNHTMGQDGTIAVRMLLDSYAATYLTGPLAGLGATFVTTPPLSAAWIWSGSVSEDRKTLLLSNGDTVSRLRLSNGSEVGLICQFERVLTRMTP